jgi:hypothetical protein
MKEVRNKASPKRAQKNVAQGGGVYRIETQPDFRQMKRPLPS